MQYLVDLAGVECLWLGRVLRGTSRWPGSHRWRHTRVHPPINLTQDATTGYFSLQLRLPNNLMPIELSNRCGILLILAT